jgi:hypothetical protein
MLTPNLICAGISVLLLLIILALIAYRLGIIAEYMINVHADLMWFRANIELRMPEKGTKPGKQREYWRDQNGFRHWRKTNNA